MISKVIWFWGGDGVEEGMFITQSGCANPYILPNMRNATV